MRRIEITGRRKEKVMVTAQKRGRRKKKRSVCKIDLEPSFYKLKGNNNNNNNKNHEIPIISL